jgi:hypothetical protein
MEQPSIVQRRRVTTGSGTRSRVSAEIALVSSILGLLLSVMPWVAYLTLGVQFLGLAHDSAAIGLGVALLMSCALSLVGIVTGLRLRHHRGEGSSYSAIARLAVCLGWLGVVAFLSVVAFWWVQVVYLLIPGPPD